MAYRKTVAGRSCGSLVGSAGMDMDGLASSWRKRFAEEEATLERRAVAAREAAGGAARVLRDAFGASEVWLFGSLVTGPRHADFDIDLAVKGLRPERYFEALAQVSELADVPVQLVTLESCAPSLRRRVHEQGIRLDAG